MIPSPNVLHRVAVGLFLGLALEQPVIVKLHIETEYEVVESTVSNRPSDFGRGGLSCQCSVDSLESRIDKSSGLGRKKR